MGLTHTISGDIASFRTPSKIPIESLKFHFLPKQASGTPTPANPIPIEGWRGLNGRRAGKNLLNADDPNISYNGLEKSNGVFVNTVVDTRTYAQITLVAYKYNGRGFDLLGSLKALSVTSYPASIQIKGVVPDECFGMTHLCIKHNGISKDFRAYFPLTLPVGASYCASLDVFTGDPTAIGGFSMGNIQVEASSNASDYEPYSGEQIPITFPISGKNKFDPNAEWIVGKTYRHIPFYFGEHEFYMSFIQKDPSIDVSGIAIGFTYLEPRTGDEASVAYTWCMENGVIKKHTNRVTQGSDQAYRGLIGRYLLVYPKTDEAYNRLISAYDIQIEFGTESTSFEPYSSDNTFYGGYIDLTQGKLIAEWCKTKIKNCRVGLNSNTETAWHNWWVAPAWGSPSLISGFDGHTCPMVCDTFWAISQNGGNLKQTQEKPIVWASSVERNFRFKYAADCALTADEFKTKYGETEICYHMETPIEYNFAPTELKAFLDHNNFWSDANDITEVTYNVCDSNMILQTKKNIIAENSKHYRKVLWNQWLPPLDENGWKAYTTDYSTATFSDGIATNTWLTDNVGYVTSIRDKNGTVQHAGEIWYASYMVKTSTSNLQWGIEMCGGNQLRYIIKTQPNIWEQCSAVSAYNRGTTNYTYICNLSTADGDQTGTIAQVASPILVNLTAMFGPGNEPTKNEFETLCKINHIDLTQYHPQTNGVEQIWCIPSLNLNDYITVEWNQWAKPVTSDYYKPYNSNNISVTVENGTITQTWLTQTIDYHAAVCSPITKTHQAGRYYYLSYEYCTDFAGYIGGTVGGQSAYDYSSKTIPNQWGRFRCLVQRAEGGTYSNYVVYLGRFSNSEIEIGNTCLLRNPIAIDITQMFGAGNEPKSVAEFEYLCTINNINLTEYHAYNSGTKIIWKI